MGALIGWFKENPDKTTQDLEKILRVEKLDIYLIAKKEEKPDHFKYAPFHDFSKDVEYMLIISCRKKRRCFKRSL